VTGPDRELGTEPRPKGKLVHFSSVGIQAPGLSADILARDPMVTQPTGQDTSDERLSDLQGRVGRGEYRVDTQAVADAILRRLLGVDLPGRQPPHAPCS
jgi:hypothetical protein